MSSIGKRARRSVQSLLARGAVAGISRLPLPVARHVGRRLGALGTIVSPTSRRRTLEHLELSLGETRSRAELRSIARRILPTLGAQLCESLVFARWGGERTFQTLEIEGLEELRATIAEGRRRGRGIIGVSAHYGHWELIAALISNVCKGDALCVVRRYEVEGYQSVLAGIRSRLGVRMRYQEDSLVPVLRHLKRGGFLGLLPDQDFRNLYDGIFVDFLGRPAFTTTTPAQLALRTGASVCAATLHREGDRLIVRGSALVDPETFRADADPVRALTEWWSRELENRIRAHPEQWVWLHRRWRTTPDRLEYRSHRRREREEKRRRPPSGLVS